MKTYKLIPLDTLFFRGGQPFNAGETGQMEVAGQFPATAQSIVGALRAALARNNGWSGKKDWSEDIKEVLGDGDTLPEGLKFHGPYLLREEELLFAVPLHVLGKLEKQGDKEQQLFTRLQPGKKYNTDIGEVKLPEIIKKLDAKGAEVKGFKALESYWLSKSGMDNVLAGQDPPAQELIPQKDLWCNEPRVGIQRDPKSRTTKDNALYQTGHVRPAKDVTLAVGIEGLPESWQPQSPAPLGGESRLVWIDILNKDLKFPDAPQLEPKDGKLYYTATFMTPTKLNNDGWKTANGKLADLPGHIVSACIGKPLLIGGWDSRNRKPKPKPLEPFLPAGSTFFMEANAGDKRSILDMHTKYIGEKTAWGYGQILIGKWEA